MADPGSTTEIHAGGTPAASGFNFKAVLQQLVQRGASDLHLKVGRPPTLRLHGELTPLEMPALRPEDLKALAEQLMTPRQVKEFTDNMSVTSLSAYRASAVFAATCTSSAARSATPCAPSRTRRGRSMS